MYIKRFTNWYFSFVLLISVMAVSCQKDANENVIDQKKAALIADSLFNSSSPDNFLAASGTLKIKVQDSTYTFDAEKDSVAFVNMRAGDNRYFGITAINKEHTMSFGISSKGSATAKLNTAIAGSQLLFSQDAIHTQQYTLIRYAEPGDAGKIKLNKYRQKDVLAKGTFFTFLSKDDNPNAQFYRVEGTFELKIK
jgi:hypothetical protein